MKNLLELPVQASRSLRYVLGKGIKIQYRRTYQSNCPRHLCHIKNLRILAKALNKEYPARSCDILLLASHWHIQLPVTHEDDQFGSIMPIVKVLSRHLQYLTEHHSATIDENLQTPTLTAFFNTCEEILQHRLDTMLQVPVSLKKLTTWNVTSWSPRLPSNQNKNRFITKSLRKGPILLQETKWTLEAATFLQQHWTGIAIASSPAQSTDTGKQGGVAILLPIGWILHEVHEILPGYALAIKAEIQSQTVWLASIYFPIHGTQQILNQISSQLARLIKDQPIFIGGDFNHADQRFLTTWNNLLSKCRVEDIEPTLETFFSPQSNSALDRILAPTELLDGAHANLTAYLVKFYHNYGHQAKQLSLRFTPKLRPHPDSIAHDTIPTSAFLQPISIHSNTAINAALAALRRAFEENPHINKVNDKGLYAKALIGAGGENTNLPTRKYVAFVSFIVSSLDPYHLFVPQIVKSSCWLKPLNNLLVAFKSILLKQMVHANYPKLLSFLYYRKRKKLNPKYRLLITRQHHQDP